MSSVIRIALNALAVLLLLAACGGSPDPRAKPLIDAEAALNSGTNAYYNDQHNRAAQQFLRALNLYQSIDHLAGIVAARINLTETAIATGNDSAAEAQITALQALLQGTAAQGDRIRLKFLQVRLSFQQGRHRDAMEILRPLLPRFDAAQKIIDIAPHSLNAIASMARLASVSDDDDARLWIRRLRIALAASEDPAPRYQALLLRLEAAQQPDATDARRGLDQALALYKQLPYRRGIAATLQQIAELEELDGNSQQAVRLLERALRIHLWVLNRKAGRDTLQALIRLHGVLGQGEKVNEYRRQLAILEKELAD